jgi:ketosteroid isomerase-like protein
MVDERERSFDILRAEQACRDLVLCAAAYADAGDARTLAALFTAEAELVRPGGQPILGREAIATAYRERPAERITVHLVCGTLFDACGPDAASATSRVLLWSGDRGSDAGPHGRPAAPRQVVGSFRDRFVRTAEGWRIARRHASFELFRET